MSTWGAPNPILGSKLRPGTSKKPTKDGVSNNFSAEYGSYSTSNLNYTVNKRTENNDLSLSIQRFETDGFSATDKTSEDDGYQNSKIQTPL